MSEQSVQNDNFKLDKSIRVENRYPLAPLTTIGIGGSARFYIRADSAQSVRNALDWARNQKVPVLILGGGSNMLISDNGWNGLVIRVGISGFDLEPVDDSHTRIVAGAGEKWDNLVALAVESRLQGIECLSGIPGTVGASPIQNIGAYGQEVKDTIEWVEAIDRDSGEIVRFPTAECEFAYRSSRFKGEDRDRYVVIRVSFLLRTNTKPSLRYGDLTAYFSQKNITDPSLEQVRSAIIEIRKGKGMVVDPSIPDSRSCGSFFMNPIVSTTEAEHVLQIARSLGIIGADDKMPQYPDESGRVKLSAAWLMDKSGLTKGFTMGTVGLSTRHVLALVNRGNGNSKDILNLVKHVQQTVRDKFQIELYPEPVFVGFEVSNEESSI